MALERLWEVSMYELFLESTQFWTKRLIHKGLLKQIRIKNIFNQSKKALNFTSVPKQ